MTKEDQLELSLRGQIYVIRRGNTKVLRYVQRRSARLEPYELESTIQTFRVRSDYGVVFEAEGRTFRISNVERAQDALRRLRLAQVLDDLSGVRGL